MLLSAIRVFPKNVKMISHNLDLKGIFCRCDPASGTKNEINHRREPVFRYTVLTNVKKISESLAGEFPFG